MVVLDKVSYSYRPGETVVDSICLSIPKGTIHALLGHNGAGKTTILRLISGLLKPASGSILIDKKDTRRHSPLDHGLSYMPESVGVYERLTCQQNLWFRARASRMAGGEIVPKIQLWLSRLNLVDRSDQLASSLSSGLRRRLSLACALIAEPRLLLLDEPTLGVDAESLDLIEDTLADLRRKGTTIVLCSHDLHFVQEVSTTVSIVQHGDTLFSGNPRDDADGLRQLYLSLTKETGTSERHSDNDSQGVS
jgi:ABC-type multidrug transport system ATPase subunit